jgi:hypothetical protein
MGLGGLENEAVPRSQLIDLVGHTVIYFSGDTIDQFLAAVADGLVAVVHTGGLHRHHKRLDLLVGQADTQALHAYTARFSTQALVRSDIENGLLPVVFE